MYVFLLRRIYLLVLFLWYQILFFCTLNVYSFGFISVSLYLFVWFGLDVHMDYVIIYLCFVMQHFTYRCIVSLSFNGSCGIFFVFGLAYVRVVCMSHRMYVAVAHPYLRVGGVTVLVSEPKLKMPNDTMRCICVLIYDHFSHPVH